MYVFTSFFPIPFSFPSPFVSVFCAGVSEIFLFFFFAKRYNCKLCLFVYEYGKLSPHTIFVQLDPIKKVKWNPVDPDMLVFSCDKDKIYLWIKGTDIQSLKIPTGSY